MSRFKKNCLLGLGLTAGVTGGYIAWRRSQENKPLLPLPGVPGETGTALVTGASSGIGAAFTRRLAAEGYNLLLVARREERLRLEAARLEQDYPVKTQILVADLAREEDVQRVEKHVSQVENLDFLINNAGFGLVGDFATCDIEGQMSMIKVHVMASVRLMRAALPAMLARRTGAIINLSSSLSFMPMTRNVTYCASKAFLNVFSEALNLELHDTGIQVQSLCPGLTRTEFHDTMQHTGSDISQVPDSMWMSPQEVVAESLICLQKGKIICVPGFKNRAMLAIVNFPPVRRMFKRMQCNSDV